MHNDCQTLVMIMGFVNFEVTRKELKEPSFGKMYYCLRIYTWKEYSPQVYTEGIFSTLVLPCGSKIRLKALSLTVFEIFTIGIFR